MIIFLKKESIKLGKAKMWIQEEVRGGVSAESDQNTAYGTLQELFIKEHTEVGFGHRNTLILYLAHPIEPG